MPYLRYPDEELPHAQVPLRQFVDTAMGLLQEEGSIDQFVRYVLAGRYYDNDNELQSRVFLNARQGFPNMASLQHDQIRDYDSALGVTMALPFTRPLSIYPVASFRDTLKKNNHIKGLAYNAQVGHCSAPLDIC